MSTPALVLGSAHDVWECVVHAEALLGRAWDGPIVACNDMIHLWPSRLDHAVSLHTERVQEWLELRREKRPWKGDPPFSVWTAENAHVNGLGQYAKNVRLIPGPGSGTGSSGFLATCVGIAVAGRAVLCGIRLDDSAYTDGATPNSGKTDAWPQAKGHQQVWIDHKEELRGRVISMSENSFTQTLLGGPNPDYFPPALVLGGGG